MMKKNNQKGAAAIWYVFVMGVMMSFGALGIEGARYITKKARLGDGLEAAAIAVSTADRVNQDFSLNRVKPVAENWVKHYINDSTKLELNIKRKDENKVNKDNMLTPYEVSYFRYDVTAKTQHKSWLNFNSWASFDPDVVVANTGTSGRIKGGHEPVDLVFVADFSGSMQSSACHGSRCRKKITALKESIKEVTEAIYKANQESTFGFIPFSKRIVIKRNNKFFCSSPLLAPLNSDFNFVRSNNNFQKLLEMSEYERDSWYINRYSSDQKKISERYIRWAKNGQQSSGTNNIDINNNTTEGWTNLNYNNHIDINRTASEITIENQPIFPASFEYFANYRGGEPKIGRYCTNWQWVNRKKIPYYYSLERRSFKTETELKAFNNSLSKMSPGGGTDMYQGLLAAPHQFYGAENKNRYIIVLSDGEENSNNFRDLVDADLCSNLNTKLSVPGDGKKYNFKMFVIGIGFNPRGSAYNTCFGEENIIPVYDMGSLTDKILGLITDDIGHNFDRYNKDSNITPVAR